MWQFRDDSLKFVDFDATSNAALEAAWTAYTADPTGAGRYFSLRIDKAKSTYKIDLELQTQTNEATKRARYLRRVDPHGGVVTHAPQWEWHGTGDDWVPYAAHESEAIEKAYVKSELSVKVNVAHGAHDAIPVIVHFGHMHQVNPSTGTTRSVRRRMAVRLPASARPATHHHAAAAHAPAAAPATAPEEKPRPARKRAVGADVPLAIDVDGGTADPPVAAAAPLVGGALPAFAPVTLASWQRTEPTILSLFAHQPAVPTRAAVPIGIAGFDMDDTIVHPKSGAVFPKSRADWQWLHPTVPAKLRELHATGHAVTIFTNQGGIGMKAWDEAKANEIRGKIIDISTALGIPMSAYVACKEDHLRKPSTAMWQMATAALEKTGAFVVDKAKSVYIGDAAGRFITTLAGRKKDFSCSDRKFARNCGVRFQTPEEWLLNAKPVTFGWDGISPEQLEALRANRGPADSELWPPGWNANEMVIFVGFPGCGKSTFFATHFAPKGYAHANRDSLKTKEKCAQVAQVALSAGKGVVIDNTNPSADDRKLFIDVAKKLGKPVRCIQFDVPREIANHMNVFRAKMGISERVSSIAYNIFQSRLEAPSVGEGFSQVIKTAPVLDFSKLPPTAEQTFFELS